MRARRQRTAAELRRTLAAAAGIGVLCISAFWISWRVSEMNIPGFDSPEDDWSGREEAALQYEAAADSVASGVKDRHEARLMALDGVEGVGLGLSPLGEQVIVVYVRDRQSGAGLPKSLDGVAVRVEVTGPIEAR